eukprot:TRINITY_DN1722_c0_g1_i2.p1 TRINITY_DN1722_c0_g1~~TRINITY_DN1722_c0_g1_i2.p1  ORF type:complete len:333 (-),score=87.83 TRINITY_DN1722_c0_g1_i2:247-1245(-)
MILSISFFFLALSAIAVESQTFVSFNVNVTKGFAQPILFEQPNITANFYFSFATASVQVNITTLPSYDVFANFPQLASWGFSKFEKDSIPQNLAFNLVTNVAVPFSSWSGSLEGFDSDSSLITLFQSSENSDPVLAGVQNPSKLESWNGIYSLLKFNSSLPGAVFPVTYSNFITIRNGYHLHFPHFDFVVDVASGSSLSATQQGANLGQGINPPDGYSFLTIYAYFIGSVNGTLTFDLEKLFKDSQIDISSIRLAKVDLFGRSSTLLPPTPQGSILTYSGGDFQLKPHVLVIKGTDVVIDSSGRTTRITGTTSNSNQLLVSFTLFLLISLLL